MSIEKLKQMGQEELARQKQFSCRIFCCTSTACYSSGAGSVRNALQQAVDARQLGEEVEVVPTGCMGLCSRGPLVRMEIRGEEGVMYRDVTPDVAMQIVNEYVTTHPHLEDDEDDDVSPHDIPHYRASLRRTRERRRELNRYILSPNIPFFTKQRKVVLANGGIINPDKLEDYLAQGGYMALAKAIHEMTPDEVCEEISESGLRGRGGAGYPTGLKWTQVRAAPGETKYVIVNGDEGDPGAYMDRTVMEDDPHRVLEGMMIAAYAVGAEFGYIYVRGEYPVAVQRLERAIREARRNRILGKSVLGTDFRFSAEVRIGAGAFVCGEETALMHSVEGQRGIPRIRPPYPSTSGLWGHPTLINNVETIANVPPILKNGAEWFADIGTEKSKGTKVFALAGQLRNTGLIEVPMGITLREIVYEIGDGVPNSLAFKAAQTGGPSGGCIPRDYLDTPVDYESLKALGSIMGSGGLIIIDESSLMPEIAKYFMDFCMDESCGKCVPCRVGTVQVFKLLDRITQGDGEPGDLEKLESLCVMMQQTSLCGLGQSAPNPVLSTLQYFRDEYETLIENGSV